MARTPAPKAAAAARAAYRGPANLSGKIAIVTGGTQGLGEAIARLFAERGAEGIVICGRNAERGRRVASDISEAGCPTAFVEADLASVADCRKVVAKADERFGRVDALVNAAALTDRGDIFDTTEERYNEIFDVNVRAPFFLIQETVQIMRGRRSPAPSSTSSPCRPTAGSRSSPPIAPRKARSPCSDPQRRPFAAQVPHPRQWPQHRLDVDAGRRPDHEDLSRRARTDGSRRPSRASRSAVSSTRRKSRAPASFSAPTNPD